MKLLKEAHTAMGMIEENETKFAEKYVTKIHGQLTDHSITQLKLKIKKLTASVAKDLRGGNHKHVRIVIAKDEYIKISEGGEEFIIPVHPGHYPDTVSSQAATRDKQVGQHKAKILQYELCTGVLNATKDKIQEAVDKEWLEEICDQYLGFKMLDHLKECAKKSITSISKK